MSAPPRTSAGPGAHYPPPAFAFSVTVSGSGSQPEATADAVFQEVSGIEAKVDLQEVTEGGLNTYVHLLPGQTRHPNLQLKRGYVTQGSALAQWAEQTVGSTLGTMIETRRITVSILGLDQQPLVNWAFDKAWPVRWEAGPLDASGNMVLT